MPVDNFFCLLRGNAVLREARKRKKSPTRSFLTLEDDELDILTLITSFPKATKERSRESLTTVNMEIRTLI
ncbi:hypothetical protein THOG10_160118 [Vibrio rotiferianus]|nr:hypothetical protein THOG10_160118 [Vibrio rotiferianus]